MNDFDRLLESELRRVLDPVVMAPIPLRRKPAVRLLGAPMDAVVSPALAVVPVALAPEITKPEL